MPDPIPVLIPMLNTNEPEALLADLRIQEGQPIRAGDILGTLETTKSTADVIAEAAGFVSGLSVQAGQTVHAGQVLCYLADSVDSLLPPPPSAAKPETPVPSNLPPGLRITQPALALAQSLGVDLNALPLGPLVTGAVVQQVHAASHPGGLPGAPINFSAVFDPTAIVIYGGGGHGKTLIELVRSLGCYRILGIIDDGLDVGASILGLPVLGGGDILPGLHQQGVRLALNAVGGIGNLSVRLQVAERLAQAGFVSPAVVHPRAVIEPSASLAPGVQVFAQAYIGSEARIETGVIINTGAIVSHECAIGAFANLSPGAILAGQVEVGQGALLGMSVTVNLQVKIGASARIGNGATVKSDVPAGAIVRAGSVWPS